MNPPFANSRTDTNPLSPNTNISTPSKQSGLGSTGSSSDNPSKETRSRGGFFSRGLGYLTNREERQEATSSLGDSEMTGRKNKKEGIWAIVPDGLYLDDDELRLTGADGLRVADVSFSRGFILFLLY